MSPTEFLLERAHNFKEFSDLPKHGKLWKSGHLKFSSFEIRMVDRQKSVLQGHSTVSKFKPRFNGPFRINAIHKNGVIYLLENTATGQRTPAHHSQLIEWREPPAYLKHIEGWNKLEDAYEFSLDSPDFRTDILTQAIFMEMILI